MSDYDDYENNLFFEPIGDMSKLNECNEGKRSVDVLMTTLEKCQKIVAKNVELEKKLKIARKALEFVVENIPADERIEKRYLESCYVKAKRAFEKIKE